MGRVFTREEHQQWIRSLPGNPAGAAMVLENSRGELLVVKASYKRYWSLPGGVVDPGESPKQAALREVRQEVGLSIDADAAEFVGAVYRSSDIRDTYQFIFGARIEQDLVESIVLQASEIEEYRFVTKEQVGQGELLFAPAVHRWANDELAIYNEEVVSYIAD